jgi:hypothetical protein
MLFADLVATSAAVVATPKRGEKIAGSRRRCGGSRISGVQDMPVYSQYASERSHDISCLQRLAEGARNTALRRSQGDWFASSGRPSPSLRVGRGCLMIDHPRADE